MAACEITVRIEINTAPFVVGVMTLLIRSFGMKMVPVVVLVEESDLEKLNKIVAPIEAEIEDNDRAKQLCADHGWSPSMLAWSRVLHSAANSLDFQID
jgi:hypothetical protein